MCCLPVRGILLIVLMWCHGPSSVQAQTKAVPGKVTYISGDSYFTDIGKDKGAAVGDTLYTRFNKAVLVIQNISRKSSSCQSIRPPQKIDVGTEVYSLARREVIKIVKDTLSFKDSLLTNLDVKSLWSGATLIERDSIHLEQASSHPRSVGNHVVGRIAVQNYMSEDRLNSNNSFQQPGGLVNFGVNRIGGSYYNFSSNMRYRKTLSQRESFSTPYPVRVYEISFEYLNPSSPYHYAVGRIFSSTINGIGNFDGALMSYKTSPEWEIGSFGGKEPNYETSKPDMANSKLGVYAHYQKESSGSQRFNSTIAFSGQYVNNKIDREYVYVQNDISFSSFFYVYMNSEIGINRSDLARNKSLLSLSNLYVMTRYKPISALTLSISYDERINVFLIQTYHKSNIPDSLFDDALRRGFRGDVNWRMTRQLNLFVSSSIRTRAGDPNKTYLSSAGLYYYNVLQTRFSLNGNYFYSSGRYTKANSVSAGISRQFADLYVSVGYRTTRYEYTSQKSTGYYRSIVGDASYSLSRQLYATIEAEHLAGKNEKADRVFTELSYRF